MMARRRAIGNQAGGDAAGRMCYYVADVIINLTKGCCSLRRSLSVVALAAAMLVGVLAIPAAAHQTLAVGPNGEYLISFGFVTEPIYTNERNGLDIIVRRADDRSPVSHLEGTMLATIISPDGTASRDLPLRAVWGEEGRYTADIVLTEPGVYHLRLRGFIFDVEFDVTFHTHEVSELAELMFP